MGARIAPHPDPKLTFEQRFAATGANTGNLLIGQSLFEELRFDEFEYGMSRSAQEVDERFDIIVVSAANFIFKNFDLGYLADYIEATKLPCLVVGLGAQAPAMGDRVTNIPEGSKRFLRIISDRSKIVGVRGNFTAEVMNDFGIRNVRVTGCPSLYRTLKRDLKIKRPDTSGPLKVSMNGSRNVFSHSANPEAARRIEADLLKLSIAEGYCYVLQNENPEMQILLSSDGEETNLERAKAIIRSMRMDVSPSDFVTHIKENGRLFFDLARWDEYISAFDYSFGSRFHGNLIALTNGVPATIITHDSRTTEMTEFMRIPHISVEDIEYVDVKEIARAGDYEAFEQNYSILYDRFADFLSENGLDHNLGKLQVGAADDSSSVRAS
ncbi:hypothetical protein ASD12_01040 [Mesorhizobium sp. Root102]|nr:hypothetical protein ASD12_01040 [Mesorhizobium sp. Root102]